MKKKGFATTGILYTLLLLFVGLLFGVLQNLQNKKTILDNLKMDTVNALACDCDTILSKLDNIENKMGTMANIDGVGFLKLKKQEKGSVNLTGTSTISETTVTASYTPEESTNFVCHVYLSRTPSSAYIDSQSATLQGTTFINNDFQKMSIGNVNAGETITCSAYLKLKSSYWDIYVDIYTDEG